ncbi:MAG: hypothetical protein FGM41_03430 [Bacteroidetes bacterium]|nr:hypothetical protein [Bacteroidota bacterium]
MKIQSSFNTVLITLSLIFFFNIAKAQPGFDDDVEDTPIDGGISLLILGSICYGGYKINTIQKNYKVTKSDKAV